MKEKIEVPVWEKVLLTIDEANAYSHISTTKLNALTSNEDCPFVIWIGSKRYIKRKQFEEYLEKAFSL